jgi:hypothetical protein
MGEREEGSSQQQIATPLSLQYIIITIVHTVQPEYDPRPTTHAHTPHFHTQLECNIPL